MFQRWLSGYRRALDLLEKVLMALSSLLFVTVVLLYAGEIFTRFFLSYSSTVSGELGLILMTWVYFLGFVVLFKRGEDVAMEYFLRFFSPRFRAGLDWAVHLAIFVFLAVLVWKSAQFHAMTAQMSHPFLPVKYSYTVQPVLAGSVLAAAVSVYFLLEKTQRLFFKAARPVEPG
jgi:TRAP-type C4-dicarboxylate transport system permease small subunit